MKNLKNENVDTTFVQLTDGETSGIAQISVDESAENHIVIVAGANHELCENDVTTASDILQNTRVLVLQLETPVYTAKKAMELCNGVRIKFITYILLCSDK